MVVALVAAPPVVGATGLALARGDLLPGVLADIAMNRSPVKRSKLKRHGYATERPDLVLSRHADEGVAGRIE